MRIASLLSLALGWGVAALSVADEASFSIKGFSVSGNTVLPELLIHRVLDGFKGDGKTFQTIQEALKALEQQYADAGYGAVRVMLPEQEVDNGVISLRVVEATVGEVKVEGQKHFDVPNIRASVPGLQEGRMPQMDDISASLRVANENGSKQTSLIFRPGKQDGHVDATLRVVDEHPLRFGLSLDNTGTKATGDYRMGFLAQHGNLFGADHVGSIQYITSPGFESKVKVLGVGYKIPLYRMGDSIDFAYGYSNVDSGTVQVAGGALGISGQGQTASAKYNVYLSSSPQWEQKLSFGFDYRAYKNSVRPVGGGSSLIPDITVHPVSLTYSGNSRVEGGEVSAYVTFGQNLPGGQDGRQEDFDNSRAGASANYQYWRYGASASYLLPANWMLRGVLAGQFTRNMLVSGEQFGVGGNESVRGFFEREVASDRGNRVSLELYSPELASWLGWENMRVQALAFHDYGSVERINPIAGEVPKETIASAGVGLRLGYARNLSMKLDYGVVTQAGGAQGKGDGRLHGSLLWFF